MPSPRPPSSDWSKNTVEKLLKFILTNIVDHPQSVKISQKTDPQIGLKTYEISVHPEDMGQIIGRQGKIIKAIRRLAYVLAATKGEKANLQLLEENAQGKEKISPRPTGKGGNSEGTAPDTTSK